MRLSLSKISAGWFRFEFAIVVVLLAGLACVGAMMETPQRHFSSAAEMSPGQHSLLTSPTCFQAADHPQAVNICSRNLQLPRAPRHRGERPTSGAMDAEAIQAECVLETVDHDCHRSFLIDALVGCPLAGHPLSLLRPPSLLAA